MIESKIINREAIMSIASYDDKYSSFEKGAKWAFEYFKKKFLAKCTRVEVIDDNGRSYVNWNEDNKVEISMQDDDRTMKIFIKNDK